MTTAHRPTWAPAKGSEHQGGARLFGPSAKRSKLDAPGFTTMKTRKPGQNDADDMLMRDFARELREKEIESARKKKTGGVTIESKANERDVSRMLANAEDGERARALEVRFATRESDEESDEGRTSEEEEETSEDDEDDDTAALLAELERIKGERARDAAAKAAKEEAAATDARAAEFASGNPLLDLSEGAYAGAASGDFKTKRRWDDDVVFRNQARDAPNPGKRFINDTIRSDFHKRFLNKYIK